jgi:flagellar basal body-associated protein FliL
VPRYRVPDVEKRLKVEEYRLRHETLGAVRSATRDELAEPSLTQLRERIEKVVNEILEDAPVKSIGFYEMSLRQR